MDDLQKYEAQPPHQEVFQYAETVESEDESMQNLLMPILRRWPIVLVTFVIACAIGVPAIWFLMGRMYETEGTIRISPIESRIMYSDSDSDRPMPNYDNFVNTEARSMKDDFVLNRVADKLKDKNLKFFENVDDSLAALRKAVNNDIISIQPEHRTELISIKMMTESPDEAELIVNAFITSYAEIARSDEDKSENENLTVLDDQQRILAEKIERHRETLRQLAVEFGTDTLTSRQEIMLEQVRSFQAELTAIGIRRISLDAQVQIQENNANQTVMPDGFMQRRNAVINSDLTIQALITNIARYEELVAVGKRTMATANPELRQRTEILATLKERLEQRRLEVANEFDKNLQDEVEKNRKLHLTQLKMELQQTMQIEENIRQELNKQTNETVNLGYNQFTIDDQREQLRHTKERYDNINRRISELQLERQRRPRISIQSYAGSAPAKGKRRKMAMTVAFAGMALGTFIAFILAKADKSFQGPDDIVKRIGVRVIGTTTGPNHIDRRLLGQQLADDYQAIRANLGLFNGQVSSKVIVITSPGAGDGKTTLAVNLAISFAQSGEKVLLIDGDLRKPDITETLNLPRNLRGLQDLLFGKDLEEVVYKAGPNGCHILAADRRNIADAFNLLNKTKNREYIKTATAAYDHVIIDTPPVLAFPDALLWTRMADGVILASLTNHTSQPDLREAIKRLEQAGANVLGTVVNNVKVSHSYHRYGYGYGYGYEDGDDGGKHESAKRSREERLLLTAEPDAEQNKEDNSDVNT